MKIKSMPLIMSGVVAISMLSLSTSVSATALRSSTPSAKTLNIGLSADPPKLDPALSSALVDRQVMINIYDTLLQLSSSNQVEADLVKHYSISNGGKKYTLTLQTGVKFQDGTAFNAQAVKFNLTRDMQPISPRHSSLEDITSILTPNPYTVVLNLKTPFSPLLSILSGRAGMMVSPAAVKKYGANFLNHPVGTGPYEFKNRVIGDHITLVKNPHYWQKGLPYFNEVVYKIFTDPNVEFLNLQSGAVQIVDTVPAQDLATLKQNNSFVLINKPSLGYQGVWFNVTSAPFTNQYLREAVNEAINRQTLVNAVLKGAAVPGNSPFSSVSVAYNAKEDTPPVPNAAKVKQFLKLGGKPNGFTFTMKIANDPVTALMAQIMQNMLSTYGIKMNIQQIEFGTLLADSENGNFQALQLGWSGRFDPDQNIYSFFYTGGPLNSAKYSNAAVDKLLNLARVQQSMQARAATYAKVDAILHQQVPYVFLYHPNNVIAYSSKLTGFQYRSDGLIRVATIR